MSDRKQWTLESAKELYEECGFELLEDEYINNQTKMKSIDDKGYLYFCSLNNMLSRRSSKKFHSSNPFTIENVKLYIKLEHDDKYELLDTTYIRASTRLTLKGKSDGYLYSISLNNLMKGKNPSPFGNGNPYTLENIKLYIKLNREDCELLSQEYKDCDEKLLFKCKKCNNNFLLSWDKFYSRNCGCPYCCDPPRKIELGINTIWDTDKWMCSLGVSEEDAKKYSHSSSEKVTVTCPNCSKQKKITLNKIYNRKSISCICKSNISYPEKFMIELLEQLNISYAKDYRPNWSCNRRYDFYLTDHNIIIETHGNQHYTRYGFKSLGGKTLEEEQENDEFKKTLALENKINDYIVIDCRKSELEWIKRSILNSNIGELFDLSKVNWNRCEQKALENPIEIYK